MLYGSVNPTRGEEGDDSSNMIYIFRTHLPFDAIYCRCITTAQ
jgi:hypothetical protein